MFLTRYMYSYPNFSCIFVVLNYCVDLVKDVQSLVSQLFPLSKVAVDRALVQGESVRDDFLCRLCKLLSTAINNNCESITETVPCINGKNSAAAETGSGCSELSHLCSGIQSAILSSLLSMFVLQYTSL